MVHSLIPSTAEISMGNLWRARLRSSPSLLTNTFRHSDQAKHSRSCLGQLLQLPKIPSQRAPTAAMPTFNHGGSVSQLPSSWPAVPRHPSPICAEAAWACPGHPENPWWWHLVSPSTAPKTSYTTTGTGCIYYWPVPSVPQTSLQFGV